MSPSATLDSDASLPEYTTVGVRPAVTSRTSRSSSRAKGVGVSPIAPRAKVPPVSPMLVTSMEPVRTSPGAMPWAVRIAAPASGEPMSGPVALPTAARAAP